MNTINLARCSIFFWNVHKKTSNSCVLREQLNFKGIALPPECVGVEVKEDRCMNGLHITNAEGTYNHHKRSITWGNLYPHRNWTDSWTQRLLTQQQVILPKLLFIVQTIRYSNYKFQRYFSTRAWRQKLWQGRRLCTVQLYNYCDVEVTGHVTSLLKRRSEAKFSEENRGFTSG